MTILKKAIALGVSSALGLSGCATSSKDISAAYVSPIQYQNYDCEQIQAENQRLTSRVAQIGGRLDEAASNDKALVGVGVVLFWPALFALGGTKQQEAEYARLKGEHDALQQAAITKKCGMTASTVAPSATTSAAVANGTQGASTQPSTLSAQGNSTAGQELPNGQPSPAAKP